jgi:hypothetical protein
MIDNGMMAMTIELTPIEVTNAIAKKLRVPVIGDERRAVGFLDNHITPPRSQCGLYRVRKLIYS